MNETKGTLEIWAIVELFGYSQMAGYLSEQSIAGTSFVRIDVPETDESPGFTKFLGGTALYSITPTTEEIARIAAARLNARPVNPWVIPIMLPESSGEVSSEEIPF